MPLLTNVVKTDLAFDVGEFQHMLDNDARQFLSRTGRLCKQFKLVNDTLHLLHRVHVSLSRRHQRSAVVRLLTSVA